MPVAIRPMTRDDVAEVATVLELAYASGFRESTLRHEFEGCTALHPELLIVAEEDERIVGTVWATFDGRRGWLANVGVLPARQGQGVVRAMFADIEAKLTALGCSKVNLLMVPGNDAIRAAFERAGYVEKQLHFMGKQLNRSDGSALG